LCRHIILIVQKLNHLSAFARWSQPIDATLYLRGKDGVYDDGSEVSPRFLCG
jgi:hypothetical protein